MFDQLKIAVAEGPEVPFDVLGLRLILALIAGAAVAWLFLRTRSGTGAPSLPATLVLLSVLIAAVTQVIGNNAARAFALVGALSIVRFRTVVRDTRDTAFVIFAVVVGMAMGAGHAAVGATTLLVGGLAAWITRAKPGRRREALDYELTIRVGLGQDAEVLARDAFREHIATSEHWGAGTARQGAALEAIWRVTLQPKSTPADLVRALNRIEGVQGVEVRPFREDA